MYQNPHTGIPAHPQQQQRQPMTQQQQQQWLQQQQWMQQQQMQQMQGQQFPQQMYGQQPMNPQQQWMLQQQQMQRQQYPQQFPQQGQHGQQFMQPGQQQFANQFQQQQQFANQEVTGRFGQPTHGFQDTPLNKPTANRFGSGGNQMQSQQQQPIPQFQPAQQPMQTQPQQQVMSAPLSNQSNSLVVVPMKHKRSVNSKLVFTTNVHQVTEKDMNATSLDEPYIMEESLPAIHSFLTEKVYDEEFDVKPVNVFAALHRTVFVDKTLVEIIDIHFNKLIEQFYKEFRKLFDSTETRYSYAVLEYIDDRLTVETNEYLSINSKAGVTIDSFVADFNDLIKLLAENDEKLNESYIEHMSEFLEDFRAGKDLVAEVEKDIPKEDKQTSVSEVVVVAYLDRHVLETGLDEVGTELTRIEKHPSNLFLLSIVELVGEKDALTFNLMTMDGCIFYVTHSEQGEVYIKRV
ncbi:hypothetical protein AGENTSMITH_61 [Bacillus phage vB_BspM_AgentSmith]|nr:hypothetical protein AGENTSMITH_61 [Bacillus phage vB_BspM_AgentSmith]